MEKPAREMEHEHVFHENGNAGSGLQFRKLERDDGNSWPALLAVHVVYRGILGDDGMEAVRRANEGRGEREELLRGERGSMPEWTCTNMQRDDRSGPF